MVQLPRQSVSVSRSEPEALFGLVEIDLTKNGAAETYLLQTHILLKTFQNQ